MRARLLALQGARQARRAHSTARPWLLFVHGLSGTHANGRSTAAASRAVRYAAILFEPGRARARAMMEQVE